MLTTSTGKPTVAQQERWDKIRARGCIACINNGNEVLVPEIHHLVSRGRRLGHTFTIGLCAHHHRGVRNPGDPPRDILEKIMGPNLARHPQAFHEAHGDDQALLDYQNGLILQETSPLLSEAVVAKREKRVYKPSSKIVPRRV